MTSIVSRVAIAAAMTLAVVCGLGSLVLIVLPLHEGLPIATLPGGQPYALLWDAALSLMFFIQHSGMNRKRARAALARVVPVAYHGAIYSIASGLALTLVVVLWQRSGPTWITLPAPGLWASYLAAGLSVAGFAWAALALMAFDPLGLRPLQAHLRGRPAPALRFVVRGPYRWVRHPLYSCAILLIWSTPSWTPDRVLFKVLWTAWIVVGAVLEERDLVGDFGGIYREYRRRVPMLVPWRRPVMPFVGQTSLEVPGGSGACRPDLGSRDLPGT